MLGKLGMNPDHLIHRFAYMKNDIPVAGCAHQAGTCRFGTDPATSVLDTDCRAHELDNLYVVDTSFFPSIGAVNPALTAMANALRVGDHCSSGSELDAAGEGELRRARRRVTLIDRTRWPLAASDLAAARSQMAFTLGFHIILASLGVAFPAMMLIANYRGLRRDDPDALLLARRWSKAVAVTFAVGAVTGTVLSFEFGLLWPAFTGRFGEVFGVLFAIEGIFFFLEAIFVAIYIFGWKRLSPWTHFWTGVPIVIAGLGGAFSVVAVNSWMNQPQGFSPTTGDVTSVDAVKVIFNPAVPYEVPHMILAAYLVTGFLVASIYAVGMLRGRRDRIHRLGLLIPLTVACIATPIQFAVGDTAARAIAKDQPIKFAAMECVQTTSTDVTEYIYGRCTSDGVKGGIGIPGFDSFLVGWSTSTQVTGLDTVPPDDRPPVNTMLHWAFDTMVGICTVLIGLGALARHRLVAEARLPAVALVPARGGRLRTWRRSSRSSAGGS